MDNGSANLMSSAGLHVYNTVWTQTLETSQTIANFIIRKIEEIEMSCGEEFHSKYKFKLLKNRFSYGFFHTH